MQQLHTTVQSKNAVPTAQVYVSTNRCVMLPVLKIWTVECMCYIRCGNFYVIVCVCSKNDDSSIVMKMTTVMMMVMIMIIIVIILIINTESDSVVALEVNCVILK